MLLNLKNTSYNPDLTSALSTRSIFVCQVLAIEGDPSWEVYRKQLIETEGKNDTVSGLTTKRTIDKGTGRIIFKLPEKDTLKIANPFLPRLYNIFPTVNDMVKVITYDIAQNDLCYDYIGPIIPSLINANNSMGSVGKRNLDSYGNFSDIDPIIDFQGTSNDVKQLYPTTNDISIEGRGSSQILIKKIETDNTKPNEYIVLRSGMFLKYRNDKVPTYNEKESFIKVTIEPDPKIGVEYFVDNKPDDGSNFIKHIYKSKYDPYADTTPIKINNIKTRVDVVGEKINLFTYPNNRDTAYSIPYGELLFQYLASLEKWLKQHKHGITGTVSEYKNHELGVNLSVTDTGHISIPDKGTKFALTKDIKII